MSVDRRGFLTGAGAVAAAGALTACGVDATGQGPSLSSAPVKPNPNPKVAWRCLTSWPGSLDVMLSGPQRVADRVKALSGGAFTIEVFEAGTLDTQLTVPDAVAENFVQCGHTASDYSAAKDPALFFATGVPFGLSPTEHLAWLAHGGGYDLIRQRYAARGLHYLACGNTGAQMGGWFTKEVTTVESLKGLTMRIGGLGAEVMARLGVETREVPAGQLAGKLRSGELGAAEFIGPHDDQRLGLAGAAKFYYYPGWWQPGDTLDLLVNKAELGRLPEHYQAMLEVACAEATVAMLAEYDARNAAALADLVRQGVQLRQFPAELVTRAQREMEKLHAEKAAANAGYGEVYASWSAFRRTVKDWHALTEGTMAQLKP